MSSRLILIQQPGRKEIDEAAVVRALDPSRHALARQAVVVDMQPFAPAVEAGSWVGQDGFLRERAAEARRLADESPDPEIHYAGLADIPQVIAFGAHFGSERAVAVHEYDRDLDSWAWPEPGAEWQVALEGVPSAPPVTAEGVAVLRVAISAEIADEDVRAAVGAETLADVTVRVAGGVPSVARVRSEAQALAVRRGVRDALAAIQAYRPNTRVVHLFAAAPSSVAFLVGQELVPRNTPPVQTYQYRRAGGGASYQPGILVSAVPAPESVPLTGEELAVAAHVRADVWPRALRDVVNYAANKRQDARGRGPWYADLEPRDALRQAAPFPELPAIHDGIVPDDDAVDTSPYAGDFIHDTSHGRWRIGDRLLVRLREAAGDDAALVPLLRLFLFHEYLHDYHSLSKYTAQGVGKFANALEHVDYTADTYAVLHELDLRRYSEREAVATADGQLAFLRDQVDQILRSFWAFDGAGPHVGMQARRVRRYMNWYWRLAQIERAPDVETVLRLFARAPKVEIAGLRLSTDGERRVFAEFRQAPGQRYELAVVLEDERLFRAQDGDNADFALLVEAFRRADHGAIKNWFRAVFDMARAQGGVFPAPHPLAGRRPVPRGRRGGRRA